MNFDMWMQLLRYSLLTLGPAAAATGYATGEQWSTIVGGIVWLVTFVWGIYVKYGTTSVPDRVAIRADVPTVNPITGTVKTGAGT